MTRPLPGWQTVAIRSNRHCWVSPPRPRLIRSSPSTRCGWSITGGQVTAPASRMSQGADQQVRHRPPPPGGGRVGQIEPVPLGLLPGRVWNDRIRAFGGPPAVGADRAQLPVPDLSGQSLIRGGEPEGLKLVEQGDGPQVRILDQPGSHILDERCERVLGTFAHPRFPLTVQVVPDRLAVPADMVGDRGDRPALPGKRVHIHVFLPCDHEERVSFEQLVSGQRPPASEETRPRWRSHTGGEFR